MAPTAAARSGPEHEVVLRVAGGSSPQSTAAAISHAVYDSKSVTLRAIGAGAVNQAVKAVSIARGYVGPRGIDLAVVPGFANVVLDGQTKSAVTLRIIVL
jgi:stage V sporulation protein S